MSRISAKLILGGRSGMASDDQNQDLMTSQAAITAGIGRYSLPPRIALVLSGSDSGPATGCHRLGGNTISSPELRALHCPDGPTFA